MQTAIKNDPIDGRRALWCQPKTVLAFVALLTLVKLIVALNTDLIRDEAYYTLWALYPLQSGYYDHPSGVVWFIKLGQLLFGETAFASRFMTILATLICSWAIWRIASRLFDDVRISTLSVYWFNLTIGAAAGLFVVTPDAPSMMFWILALWCAAELQVSGKSSWLFGFGLFAGLGLSSKYTGFFLGAGILLWLIFIPDARRWFFSTKLYLSGVLAIAIFAPVIAWNIGADFSSFAFQMGRTNHFAGNTFPNFRYMGDFIGAQFGLLLPWLFLAVCIGFFVFFKYRKFRTDAGLGLLVLTALPILIYFAIFSTHSQVLGNWTWPLYAQFSILGAWVVYGYDPVSDRTKWFLKQIRIWQLPFSAVIVTVIYVHAVFGLLRTPFYEHTRDMHGWTDVATAVQKTADDENINTILTFDYGVTGWLASYAVFEKHRFAVIPASQFYRYGFIDLPDDDALAWPALAAFRVRVGQSGKIRKPRLLKELESTLVLVEKIARRQPNDHVDDYIYLYRMEKPARSIFPDQD